MSPTNAHGCEQVSVFQIRPSKSSIRCGKTGDSTIGRGQFAKQCGISSPIHGEELTADVVALVAFDYRHHEGDRGAPRRPARVPGRDSQHESVTHQGEWCLESVYCQEAASAFEN